MLNKINSEVLRIQLISDTQDLLNDVRAGLYKNNFSALLERHQAFYEKLGKYKMIKSMEENNKKDLSETKIKCCGCGDWFNEEQILPNGMCEGCYYESR